MRSASKMNRTATIWIYNGIDGREAYRFDRHGVLMNGTNTPDMQGTRRKGRNIPSNEQSHLGSAVHWEEETPPIAMNLSNGMELDPQTGFENWNDDFFLLE
jgi:hypothetical protein